jgi:hypothetical protein
MAIQEKNLNVFFLIFGLEQQMQKHRSKTPSGNLTFTIIVYEGARLKPFFFK